jgi:hypothetical protein
VKRKEGAGNSAPSHSSNLPLILNREVLPHLTDGGPGPDESNCFRIEIRPANQSDYHALGPFGCFQMTAITSLKARP